MHRLMIDIETYSDEDLRKVGVYKYTDSDNFKILMLTYQVDDQEEVTLDLEDQEIPSRLLDWLMDPNYTKEAWNAQFERISFTHYLRRQNRLAANEWLDAEQWRDTMIEAMELGLPASLKQAANYLNVDQVKDPRGVRLINYFSKPNKDGQRNLPDSKPEDWETYKYYNAQDVRTERAISDKLSAIRTNPTEWKLWAMDQRINDRGVRVDQDLAEGAVSMMNASSETNLRKLKQVTGLDNPNSLKQFKAWLEAQGTPMEKLGKALVQKALDEQKLPDDVRTALELRLKLSNTSTKKYLVMENASCSDGRIHGLLQFYGASRTGRWAGRLLQVQNLPRNYLEPLDVARVLVKDKDEWAIETIFDSVPDTLKQLIRTGLIAEEGSRFVVCDFSAIEARVIAWYANEQWTLEAFRTHGKIYEATAANMFNLGRIEDFDWKSHDGKAMRQRGKIATLALGYQGGIGALKAMGALDQGIPEDELPELVDKWRKANKHIVRFWYDVEAAAKDALSGKGVIKLQKGLKFFKQKGFLFIQLPSGRRLAYANPRLEDNGRGTSIIYEGQGDRVGFTELDTYGGKLVENIIQATARDLLAQAMYRLEQHGYQIVFHIHDEAVAEMPYGQGSVEEMRDIMCEGLDWAKGLPLNAAGFENEFYMKD